MKSIFLAILVCFFQYTTINAQEDIANVPEFGKVEMADLQLKDCSFSPGVAAMNLLKYKEVELHVFPNGNTEVVILTRYRIKIFGKQGYKYATVSIPFSNDNSIKIKDIKAVTYNTDGNAAIKATAIKESDIYKIEGARKDKHKSIKFTFPEVNEGSVLEYQFVRKYRLVYDVPSWYFQDDIPNKLTVYKVSRPVFSNIQKRVVAELPIEETHTVDDSKGAEKKQLQDCYIMKNVPAFKKEVFMSSSLDYKYRMDFLINDIHSDQPFNIWAPANSWLLRLPAFGGVFDAKIPGTKAFIDSVKKLGTVPEKIRSVYNYVRQKVKWMEVYYKYARDLDEVWKDGEGTSAEINLSLLNLLRKCGVQCFPVLYSTRWNGKVDYTFPDLSQFNTVNIAVVNGKKFDLLDGTNPYLSYETPPFNVVNRTGMLIDPLNHTKINIDFDRKLIWDSIYVSATIGANGVLKGKIEKKYFDLAKSMKLQSTEEEEEEMIISLANTEVKLDTTWKVNAENELLPLIEFSRFHYEMPAAGNYYFINPFLFSDFTKSPFTDSTRISDVDFGASTASVVNIEIKLPKGITPEELPKNKEIYSSDSAILFSYHNQVSGDIIRIQSSIEIKKPIFSKKEYGSLKKAFQQIYSELSNQVLLRRKDDNE